MKVKPERQEDLRQAASVIRRHGSVMVICDEPAATSSARAESTTRSGNKYNQALSHTRTCVNPRVRRPGPGSSPGRLGARPPVNTEGHRTWHVLPASTSPARSASRSPSPTSIGVGRTRAKETLAATGVSPDIRVKDADGRAARSRCVITSKATYKVEGDLRREVRRGHPSQDRDRFATRAFVTVRGLPVRGQRTKTNARTRKGPKRTVAGKKKAK